jgi:hypothetical protein
MTLWLPSMCFCGIFMHENSHHVSLMECWVVLTFFGEN